MSGLKSLLGTPAQFLCASLQALGIFGNVKTDGFDFLKAQVWKEPEIWIIVVARGLHWVESLCFIKVANVSCLETHAVLSWFSLAWLLTGSTYFIKTCTNLPRRAIVLANRAMFSIYSLTGKSLYLLHQQCCGFRSSHCCCKSLLFFDTTLAFIRLTHITYYIPHLAFFFFWIYRHHCTTQGRQAYPCCALQRDEWFCSAHASSLEGWWFRSINQILVCTVNSCVPKRSFVKTWLHILDIVKTNLLKYWKRDVSTHHT